MASQDPSAPAPALPAPPSPSADAGIVPSRPDPHGGDSTLSQVDDIDIFTLKPVAALKLLCDMLETLVRMTGDVPPTPPVSQPKAPRVDVAGVNKENEGPFAGEDKLQKRKSRQWVGDDGDVPHRARTPIGSPEARATEPVHIELVDADIEALVPQHLAIARKFYSKKPPPIALEEYLGRLHRYCPMSAGVYLAAGAYIHRIALVERLLPVTPRNVHRLVLAGLRVTMKALEDLSYPHTRFAKVGGVSEAELGRLEMSFCFAVDFELQVTSETLLEYARTARNAALVGRLPETLQPKLPPSRKAVKDELSDL